jgi:hypothetical protein
MYIGILNGRMGRETCIAPPVATPTNYKKTGYTFVFIFRIFYLFIHLDSNIYLKGRLRVVGLKSRCRRDLSPRPDRWFKLRLATDKGFLFLFLL